MKVFVRIWSYLTKPFRGEGPNRMIHKNQAPVVFLVENVYSFNNTPVMIGKMYMYGTSGIFEDT